MTQEQIEAVREHLRDWRDKPHAANALAASGGRVVFDGRDG